MGWERYTEATEAYRHERFGASAPYKTLRNTALPSKR